jgi:hypothetical protein
MVWVAQVARWVERRATKMVRARDGAAGIVECLIRICTE